jgi:hypothetical protein
MSNGTKHENGHGGFERQDLQPGHILYFLLGLGVAIIVSIYALRAVYAFLEDHENATQTAVNPLVTNVPTDTRHLPPSYNGNYEEYLKANFPAPQLEINERTELNGERLREEQTLYSYGWVDQRAGIVRIPIDRAMDLLVQRGLPVRQGEAGSDMASNQASALSSTNTATKKKANKQ